MLADYIERLSAFRKDFICVWKSTINHLPHITKWSSTSGNDPYRTTVHDSDIYIAFLNYKFVKLKYVKLQVRQSQERAVVQGVSRHHFPLTLKRVYFNKKLTVYA